MIEAHPSRPTFPPPALHVLVLAAALALAPTASARPAEIAASEIASPTGPGALAPNLATTARGIALTWLEPYPGRPGDVSLRVAFLEGERWSEPVTVTRGGSFFSNWADFPALIEGPAGELVVHWLHMLGDDTYAYGAGLARSTDGGRSWEELGLLHDDASPTEHGFVSYVALPDGIQAFWLDGRAMANDGPMGLRTTRLEGGVPRPSTLLDDRVCECCQTDAAFAAGGPVVVYRDRTEDEVRDISLIRRTAEGWSEAVRVGEDGWTIPGCPVNGPAVAARDDLVAVAWFTGANRQPRVKAAVSRDGGATFSAPLVIDGERPTGRVDVVLAGGEAWITWLGRTGDGTAVMLRPLELDGAEPALGEPRVLSRSSEARSSGFPRMAVSGDRLLIAWVDVESANAIRTSWAPLRSPAGTATSGR
ncbi:MAG TPA: sialidase family protein [Thermoanaerobaculia bacterium]|nr:sialidase family protein [Thermoanaerobaculia bacterium]